MKKDVNIKKNIAVLSAIRAYQKFYHKEKEIKKMEITIYASKKSYEKDGKQKSFYVYSTRLLNKSTEDEVFFTVKFREDCGAPLPANCPCNIVVEKKDVNITEKERIYDDKETGEEKTAIDRVIWVGAWKEGAPFEDHSTDDYWT